MGKEVVVRDDATGRFTAQRAEAADWMDSLTPTVPKPAYKAREDKLPPGMSWNAKTKKPWHERDIFIIPICAVVAFLVLLILHVLGIWPYW